MQIISVKKINTAEYGAITEHPNMYAIHAQIDSNDFENEGLLLIHQLNDTNWMSTLDDIDRVAYDERARQTIEKLTQVVIQALEESGLTKEFGEYLISHSAQEILHNEFRHTKIPLAELWKERKTGNPGFDFHTLSNTDILVFGEAKYQTHQSPYKKAIQQVDNFINEKKDRKELTDLRRFVSENASRKVIVGDKGYTLAFSIRGNKSIDDIFRNSIRLILGSLIMNSSEIYIIAIEII